MLTDCPNCRSRLRVDPFSPLRCPACTAWIVAEPVPDEQVCNAEFHDDTGTRCALAPHAADEHDPEHYGRNPETGAWVRWRASEVDP